MISRNIFKAGVIIFFFLFFPFIVYTSSNSPPDGYTGGGGDNNCTACHITYPLNSGIGSIEIKGLPSGYVADSIYNLTFQIEHSGQSRWGFELKSSGGQLFVSDSINTQLSGGIYLKHTNTGTYAGQTSGKWDFQWSAPSIGSGIIYFYAAGNASDNSNNRFGDYIYTMSTSVTEYLVVTDFHLY